MSTQKEKTYSYTEQELWLLERLNDSNFYSEVLPSFVQAMPKPKPVYRLKNQLHHISDLDLIHEKRAEIAAAYTFYADGQAFVFMDAFVPGSLYIVTPDGQGYIGDVFSDTEEVKARIDDYLHRGTGIVNNLNP